MRHGNLEITHTRWDVDKIVSYLETDKRITDLIRSKISVGPQIILAIHSGSNGATINICTRRCIIRQKGQDHTKVGRIVDQTDIELADIRRKAMETVEQWGCT